MSDDIQELARRGEEFPESLSEDEIRMLALAVLEDLGYTLESETGSTN